MNKVKGGSVVVGESSTRGFLGRMREGAQCEGQTMQISDLEQKLITIFWTITFVVALAAFSISFLTHDNTFALADAVIRRFAPHASVEDISKLHIMGRELGHFFIPAGAYLALVLGPLRNRCYVALALCAMFAVLDETLQTFSLRRTGSISDVAVDVAGALSGFLVYLVIADSHRRAVGHLRRAT